MTIATQTGDHGATSLLFGRRVSKTDPRIGCNGAVDELNAALGMARASLKATLGDPLITARILAIQKELIVLMGELAVVPADRERHRNSDFGNVSAEMVDALSAIIDDLEKNHRIEFHRWATPGDSLASAALEVARCACRRAERVVVALRETDETLNGEILRYLNRLSDLLWLWARWMETMENSPQPINA